MRISINGPSPENYHATLAVGRWMESGREKQEAHTNGLNIPTNVL